jgi:hypothetical protein
MKTADDCDIYETSFLRFRKDVKVKCPINGGRRRHHSFSNDLSSRLGFHEWRGLLMKHAQYRGRVLRLVKGKTGHN